MVQKVFQWEGKTNRNALYQNAEGVRRGAEGAKSFNAARGSGERCKLPPVGPAGARPPNDIWCIFGLKGYCKCLLTKNWQQIVPSPALIHSIAAGGLPALHIYRIQVRTIWWPHDRLNERDVYTLQKADGVSGRDWIIY